jgi:hypothetical protein
MIKRQLVECVATALAVGQPRFVRKTHDRCVLASWRAARRAAWLGRPAGRNGQARKFHSDGRGSNSVHNCT